MEHFDWKYFTLFCVFSVFIVDNARVLGQDIPQILDVTSEGKIGGNAHLVCNLLPDNATPEWLYKGAPIKTNDRVKTTEELKPLPMKDLDGNVKNSKIFKLFIANVTSSDSGNYTCLSKDGEKKAEFSINLDLSFPGKLLKKTDGPIKLNATDQANVTLRCVFEIYNATDVKWYKQSKDDITELLVHKAKQLNLKEIESTYEFQIKRPEDNGTYTCEVYDDVTLKSVFGKTDVFVYAPPKVLIDTVKAISSSQLFLNWTVHNYNAPIRGYNLMYRRLPSSDFNQYTREKIGIKNTSFVVEGLDNSTKYQVKLEVTTSYGSSSMVYAQTVETLSKDPVFVPNISINGFSATSVTISITAPPEDIAEYIHYYLLEARMANDTASKTAYHSRDDRNLPYMFDDLEPYSTYIFRVRSCSEYTKKCGNWSEEMNAATLDGKPGKPANVTVVCQSYDPHTPFINITWDPPSKPNGEIKGYTVEITGVSMYKDSHGMPDTYGPLSKSFGSNARSARHDDLRPNMNYTVKLSAMTRTRRVGEEQIVHCVMAQGPPDHPPRTNWKKISENNKFMFKANVELLPEKNCPICCYRVYMVRLLPTMGTLLEPKDINIISYKEAHAPKPLTGAYVTDIFSNRKYPPDLIMGDDKSFVDNTVCKKCFKKPKRAHPESTRTTTTTIPTTVKDDYDEEDSTIQPVKEEVRERRSAGVNGVPYPLLKDNFEYSRNSMMMDGPSKVVEVEEDLQISDGSLDSESNYTMFVEVVLGLEDVQSVYTDYLNTMMPAPNVIITRPTSVIEIVLQVTCAILALVLIAMIIFCIRQTRKARKMPHNAHIEINPISAAFRYVVEQVLTGGRNAGSVPMPPDLPPIAKEDLPAAYAERQADSDYGFQKEFELLQMLPDCFPDRTTLASEARENQPKNRYPDIKAYDQTRVKLSQIDSIVGSDYINANYVMGYKERKQFICAQGPTDTTVNDFWRMIWEQRLELVVMLTNLEEYSKVKCSRYWPDEVRGVRAFGNICVTHYEEKRYSDYIVRQFKICKQRTNSDGQPIVENNGVKRNGDCNSTPTSPRDKSSPNGTSERTVLQYHFLMWKDFAAPEHAHSILKFIKRVNEAWSDLSGRPIVVHCSAGVGRTGTLVALDCLLQQLREEGQVSVFNTVAELRSQRNFLVQSLKQYVFVYRALVEYAHYGDTEIPASKLKSAIDRLRNTPEGADKCLMEHEFEKMLSSPVTEPLKSCAAGAAEELRPKNRSQDCLPYDRNRVILTPMPSRDYSTYINASFIEAYDNSEGFIITQDPLPNTIMDFWRMVSEHNVSTIIMLSEIGEGDRKCPRYWDDETAQYEHMSVQYEESECCPYYTRRQFTITNTKNGEVSSVRHVQYHGWPTAPGHVPEVTRGLAELVDAADIVTGRGPALAHCHLGTERSSLFVALCILISQLRVEKRVDVNCVARKVRSQRAHTIDTFLQYEFLHRAILNYAELHNLMDDS